MPKGSLQAEWHSLGIGAAQIWRLTALGQGTEKGSASSPGTTIGLLGRNRNPRAGQELEVREAAVAKSY